MTLPCDSEIIDSAKINYFRLFFYVIFLFKEYHCFCYFVNSELSVVSIELSLPLFTLNCQRKTHKYILTF